MGRRDKPVAAETAAEVAALAVGQRMRYERQQRGITLSEMANRLGYTKAHVSAVENGRGTASTEFLQQYEQQLGVPVGLLTQLQTTERGGHATGRAASVVGRRDTAGQSQELGESHSLTGPPAAMGSVRLPFAAAGLHAPAIARDPARYVTRSRVLRQAEELLDRAIHTPAWDSLVHDLETYLAFLSSQYRV